MILDSLVGHQQDIIAQETCICQIKLPRRYGKFMLLCIFENPAVGGSFFLANKEITKVEIKGICSQNSCR
jgi:hypothetical protein